MMVKAKCQACGDVEVESSAIMMFAHGGAKATSYGIPRDIRSYAFNCPGCGGYVEHQADQASISLLASTDARISEIDEPDWDGAFAEELLCGGTHRWDFPTRLGQRYLCGEEEWSG